MRVYLQTSLISSQNRQLITYAKYIYRYTNVYVLDASYMNFLVNSVHEFASYAFVSIAFIREYTSSSVTRLQVKCLSMSTFVR